jgi:DsbC/DsbD-like thiol-disulfide interchange protein
MTRSATAGLSLLVEAAAMFSAMVFNHIMRTVNPCWISASALVLLVTATMPAGAATGDWVGEGNARVRLLAAGVNADGRLAAGIEIDLDPGWKTYWRSPGDAGIAPVADFSASTNIGGPVEIGFPVPHRLDDGYAVTNIYEGRIVLPLSAAVTDAASAVKLAVGLDIGVCEEICVPAHYDLTLEVPAGESDPEAGAILADAEANLPGKPEPDVFAVESIVRTAGTDKRPVFDIGIVAPDAGKSEIFVEGPIDWYPAPPKLFATEGNRATFSIEFSRLGAKTPIGGNDFRVTIVSGGRAIEDVVTLD